MTNPASTAADDEADTPGTSAPKDFSLESILGSIPALPNTSPDFEREIEIATEEAIIRKYGWLIPDRETPHPEDA